MSLVQLQNAGIVKFIVSQNVDGLFLRSGIKYENLSELHGNVYTEACSTCGYRYLRDFDAAMEGNDKHFTGRFCTQSKKFQFFLSWYCVVIDKAICGGKLKDSIINFGEKLPNRDQDLAIDHSKKVNNLFLFFHYFIDFFII